MLVLTRKAGESIQIGDNITIHVRRIESNRIALAIDAPREISILRGELAASDQPASSQAAAHNRIQGDFNLPESEGARYSLRHFRLKRALASDSHHHEQQQQAS